MEIDRKIHEINIQKSNNPDRKIVIFGAGELGKKIFYQMQNKSMHIDYFCDNNLTKQKDGFLSPDRIIEIISFKRLMEFDRNTMVIFAINKLEKAKKEFNILKIKFDNLFIFQMNMFKNQNNYDVKYAIQKMAAADNIGEEIQVLPQISFMPRIDNRIDKEQLYKFKDDVKNKIILNGWFMHYPEHFLPSSSIEPLFISMYLNSKTEKIFFKNKHIKDYFLRYAPIGCRDIYTAESFVKNGIPSYYSGCLSLTLQRNDNIKKEDFILCVDCPDAIVQKIRTLSKKTVFSISKWIVHAGHSDRLNTAKVYLWLFQSASLVISPNMHTINPCLALGTSVLRLKTRYYKGADRKFIGAENFYNTITDEEIINNKCNFDFNSPSSNPKEFMQYRKSLIETCERFTGFDSRKPAVDIENPTVDLLKILYMGNRKLVGNSLYFCKPLTLLETFFKRVFLRKNKYDFFG